MPFIKISDDNKMSKIKIMIFTEGTVLKPKNKVGLFSFSSYIPIADCVCKIQSWQQQGAEIVYCTSRSSKRQVNQIASLLNKYHFAGTKLYYREPKQKYNEIVEIVMPNILIEDDCKSIGGQWQMCITYVEPRLKSKIKSIVVEEFGGIDHLPTSISDM